MSEKSADATKRAGDATLEEIIEIAESELQDAYPVQGDLHDRGIKLRFLDDAGEEWTWTVTSEGVTNE